MHAELLPRRSGATHRLRTVVMLVSVLVVVNNCGQSGDTSSAEEPRGSVSSSSPAQGMPLVVVPTDSPRFKQLRVEPAREHAFPTDEVVAPAKVTINPNRISRVMPPVQGRVLAVSVKLGDPVVQGQQLLTLDSPDADAAISTYLQADATLRPTKVSRAKTQPHLERPRKLLQYEAISEKDALASQNDAATAQA